MVRGVVFDFDMTLVDSSRGIWNTICAVAREQGLREPSLEEVKLTIGLPLSEALEKLLGQGGSGSVLRYREIMRASRYAGIVPFPDTAALLKEMKRRDIALAVATNRHDAEAAMEAVGLLEVCPVAVGAGGLASKPDPAVLLEALRRLNLLPKEAVYVGDTDIDMKTAVNAGVRAIGVATGNCDPETLEKTGAVKVLSRLGELTEYLKEL